ncbi:MAG: hypothetical protein IK031_02165 [Bacteroidales bacterium]|nr:hypothetical protein [Bacteroidales bacterium]
MKLRYLISAALFLAGCLASAQDVSSIKSSYERQVRRVGPAGVGVETIIDRWEAADPDSPEMLHARFSFCVAKARSTNIEPRDASKYLGQSPFLTLKDSTGRDVFYYEVDSYDDELFGAAKKTIDRAISLVPDEFGYRVDKIDALILYEKDSPDMALQEIMRTIDYNASKHPSWTLRGEKMEQDIFQQAIQEFCFTFFHYGTPSSFEAFRVISERMNKEYPRNTEFLNNLGSYWLVCKSNPRKALKWYEKVFKISPDDYSAARNCVLVARRDKNVRLEKKYLPALIRATSDELERSGYEARLEALNQKK